MNTKYIRSGIYYEIEITTDPSGRTSIIVTENPNSCSRKQIVDVELPAKEGYFKDSFKSSVKIVTSKDEIEITRIKVTKQGIKVEEIVK